MNVTPGPWINGGETLDRQIEIIANGQTVCIVLPDDEDNCSPGDARRIAANPDMFEALLRALQTLELHGKIDAGTPLHNYMRQVVDRAIDGSPAPSDYSATRALGWLSMGAAVKERGKLREAQGSAKAGAE